MRSMQTTIIDAHCHLDFTKFNRDRDEAIQRARNAGVVEMINSGIDHKTNLSTLALAEQYDFIHPALGLSPLVVSHYGDEVARNILTQLEENAHRAIAIGEAGMDYFHHKDEKEHEHQREVFRKVIDIAESTDLPLVIHGRDAEADALQMVQDLDRVIFHCYGGSLDTMQEITDAGYYISISTLVCFSEHHQSLVKNLPLDRMLIETDSPYLSPRKGRNEPAYMIDSVSTIARLRHMEETEVADITRKNTYRAFGL